MERFQMMLVESHRCFVIDLSYSKDVCFTQFGPYYEIYKSRTTHEKMSFYYLRSIK